MRDSRGRRLRRTIQCLIVTGGVALASFSIPGAADATASSSNATTASAPHQLAEVSVVVTKRPGKKHHRRVVHKKRAKAPARKTVAKKATPRRAVAKKPAAKPVPTKKPAAKPVPAKKPAAKPVPAPKPAAKPVPVKAPVAPPAVGAKPIVTAPTAPVPGVAATGTFASVLDALIAGLPSSGLVKSPNVFALDIRGASVNSNSAAMVDNLVTQVQSIYGGIAAFNVWNYNVSVVKAQPGTLRRRVIWDNCQGKAYTPSQLYSASGGATFVDVPIPDDAVPSSGTDGQLTIWDPASDKLWELWKARKQDDGWHACWGGRIDHWSTSPGYFPNGMGASASGLAVVAGTVGIAEMQAGTINHALTLAVRSAAHWKTFSYPAQRSDGDDYSAGAIPEGTRFRLDPNLNLSNYKLTPVARAVAQAAQRYGFIVTDKAGAVTVSAENGSGISAETGSNPWVDLLGGTPSYLVMRNFPWDKLQALPFDYGKP